MAATNCKIYGPEIVFESKYKNLGFWGHVDDQARWQMKVVKDGRYDVFLTYACPVETAGNAFEFRVDTKSLNGKVVATESWDKYRRYRIGGLELKAGQPMAKLSAVSPLKGFLLDFQSIQLVPADASSLPKQ